MQIFPYRKKRSILFCWILLYATAFGALGSMFYSWNSPCTATSETREEGNGRTNGVWCREKERKMDTSTTERDTNLIKSIDRPNPTPRPLLENAISNSVHFLWCSEGNILEFNHYLTIKSAIRALQPTSVTLHYLHWPFVDNNFYHRWFQELREEYSFFLHVEIDVFSVTTGNMCTGSIASKKDAIMRMLNETGGIYIGIHTWLLDLPVEHFLVDAEIALDKDSMEGYMILRDGTASSHKSLSELEQSLVKKGTKKFSRRECVPTDALSEEKQSHPQCLIMNKVKYKGLVPADIMKSKTVFSKIVRTIYYGSPVVPRPVPKQESLVPNIVHMIWLGTKPMNYLFYLSVLSSFYILEADNVYIHCENRIVGVHWNRLKANGDLEGRLIEVLLENPNYYLTKKYDPLAYSLVSHWVRNDILIRYGGFYIDTDAVWVKPFTKEQRRYEMVGTLDWVDWYRPFPASMNLGVSYAQKNAPFLHLMKKQLTRAKRYADIPGYVATKMPYKVYERYPETILVDPHLQVICYKLKCHPTWESNFHNIEQDHIKTGSLTNWTEIVHAFHWTHPTPAEFSNETALLNAKGLFANVGKRILRRAGLL